MRQRDCDEIWPGRLNTTGFTHIVLSFAVFDPKTFAVGMQDPKDEETYRQFLRLSNSVSKGLAIGGWNMSNEGPTRTAWSDMSSTKSNRKAFIDSLKQFLQKWKFSAIELHWQWPGTTSRGGNPADTQNQVDLVHELRDSLGKDFGISVVLPAQYEYLKSMDPLKMQDAVDWFTVLTYDLHGPWDATVNGLGPKIKPHTDLAEIDSALDLLRAAQLEPSKINMGVANYGRGFTVADQNCKYYGCKFTGPSMAGSCTKEDGLLSACEIRRIIRAKGLTPQIIPGGASVKEIAWENQWIGYDDDETLGMKLELANKRCLGGTSLWAIDYNHCDGGIGAPPPPGNSVEPGPLPSAPMRPTQPIPSNAPSFTTSEQGSAIPQPHKAASSVPSMAPSATPSIAPSNVPSIAPPIVPPVAPSIASSIAPSYTKSAQESNSPSSTVWSSNTGSQIGSSHSDTPSSWKGSAHPIGVTSLPGPVVSVSSIAGSSTTSSPAGSSSSWSSGQSSFQPSSSNSPSSTGGFLIAPSLGASSRPGGSATPSSDQGSSNVGSPSAPLSRPLDLPTGLFSTTIVPSSLPSSGAFSDQASSQFGSITQGVSLTVPEVPSSSAPGVIWPPFSFSSSQAPIMSFPAPAVSSPAPGISLPVPVVSWSTPGVSSSHAPSISVFPGPWVSTSMAVISLPAPGTSVAFSSGQAPPPVTHSSSAAKSSDRETVSPKPTSVQGSGTPPMVTPIPIATSSKALPTIIGCPDQCRGFEWCKIFCEGWKFPRPDYVQPPPECRLPENSHCDGDPDSHSDSDPECKPNDCVSECVKWRLVTFLITKRPICPCVPKKCDKDGESDSPSDSDRDDPKIKPKPTSRPKEKKPDCKLFGCGCGWMGIGFGPGCPGLEVDLTVPCGLFGCNPCTFFGCPGTQPEGIVGYGGYCPGKGCEPCPPELCSRPGCTLPGGCGPKPGPAPTKPPNRPDPEDCDDSKRTIVTERFVWCTEGFNVSALPSSLRGTSSTMISSLCVPMIDATVTVCGGAMPGFDTTTTMTGTNTLTSDAPACTRAPLSLNDDEGNNIIRDPLNTSTTFASNTTSKHSTSKHSTSMNTTSTSKQSTKTSFAPPSPTLGHMDKNGYWKVNISQHMVAEYSEIKWVLIDPNGHHAGEHQTKGNNMMNMTDTIKTIKRPVEHQMPFEIDLTVSDPRDVSKCRVSFLMSKSVPGCDFFPGAGCKPYMTTETFIEDKPFAVQVCEDECKKQGKKSPLFSTDLWCQDLNDADWEPEGAGWKRDFQCGWKGF
ncbi:glycoside hydrolase family 18 protein [Exserohilum turcica Et28A]|uniref:chitinase n=1 Tax=Exserohilum turcicum (strain 28A) TaxID=671987 RepID=R0IK06_EXST2|nr:glycoside hydrolase family 18 protein [Exserohilum turcica Et28A]EOA85186.1 glycoside hydrolase family 18 protein [Exserohilum turcica Et28A]